MTETIIVSLLIARYKGYKWTQILNLFKHWSMYPIIATCLAHIYFVVLMIRGEYWFLEYAIYIKMTSLAFYFVLIWKYNLLDISMFKRVQKKGNELFVWFTSPVTIGALLALIGSKLNKIAIACNSNKMPVFPSVSFGTGYSKIDMFEKASMFKDFHSLGTYDTNLIFLTDVFDFFFVIMSVGDILLRIFVVLVIFFSIVRCNKNKNND